jgi:large subunit ribosomal protein L1
VAVLTANPAQQEAARKAGATLVGGEELIQEIKEQGGLAADVLVAHPEMMPRLAPVAKILGPQGLMPNPKDGTISTEPAKVVKELLGGQLPFKMDSSGNVHAAIARTSWPPEKILQNARAFLEAVEAAKPDKAPADFIRGITIATTFSPSVRIKI